MTAEDLADIAPRAAVCGDCLRPKFTTDDLSRWRAEFPDGQPKPDPITHAEAAAKLIWDDGAQVQLTTFPLGAYASTEF